MVGMRPAHSKFVHMAASIEPMATAFIVSFGERQVCGYLKTETLPPVFSSTSLLNSFTSLATKWDSGIWWEILILYWAAKRGELKNTVKNTTMIHFDSFISLSFLSCCISSSIRG